MILTHDEQLNTKVITNESEGVMYVCMLSFKENDQSILLLYKYITERFTNLNLAVVPEEKSRGHKSYQKLSGLILYATPPSIQNLMTSV